MRGSKKFAALTLAITLLAQISFARVNATLDFSPLARRAEERRAVEQFIGSHRIINIVDDFLAFWEVAKDKTPFYQRMLWFYMVESKHRDYFERAVYRDATEEERQVMLDEFLIRVPSEVEAIRELNRTFYSLLTETFFDFKYRRFFEYDHRQDIYFGLSLFRFDGAVRPVGNDEGIPDTLCLGAEALASYTPDDVRIAITHEFFHLYHFGFLFEDAAPEDFQLAHMPLMIEGMAVAGTEECYPNHPRSAYLHFGEEELAFQQRDLGLNAARFLDLVQFGVAPGRYSEWFTNNYTSDVPSRGGYLLGYEVAKRLMAKYTIEQIVRMKPAELRPHVEEYLWEMASGSVFLISSND